MNFNFEIPKYNDYKGLDVFVEKNAKMIINCKNDCVEISANSAALISLAKQFLYLAKNDLPEGSHIHYDGFFMALGKDSKELVISKE